MSQNSSSASGEEALAALRDRLQELYRRRGRPSYRELARLTGQALSHTTVGMVIHCRRLPRLGQLELVVEALDGDPEAYQALWLAADEADSADSAAVGTRAPALPGGPYRPTGTALPHGDAVDGVAFHPGGHLLATHTEGRNATVRLWDVTTGDPLGDPLITHNGWVHMLAFHPDGHLLATVGDEALRLWDGTTGRPAGEVRTGHRHPVFAIRALAFYPEGRLLASTGNDATVRLWDVMTGEPVRSPLMGHIGFVADPAFHPDGHLLATAGLEDGNVRLWDVPAHQPVGEPLPHSGSVGALAFHPDGHLLATGGRDATLRLWRGESTPEPHLSRRRAERLRARLTAVREDRDRLARELAPSADGGGDP